MTNNPTKIEEVLEWLTPDERNVINKIARARGKTVDTFTVQHLKSILNHARAFGDLTERYKDEADA